MLNLKGGLIVLSPSQQACQLLEEEERERGEVGNG